jgi:hypothetical protein
MLMIVRSFYNNQAAFLIATVYSSFVLTAVTVDPVDSVRE